MLLVLLINSDHFISYHSTLSSAKLRKHFILRQLRAVSNDRHIDSCVYVMDVRRASAATFFLACSVNLAISLDAKTGVHMSQ